MDKLHFIAFPTFQSSSIESQRAIITLNTFYILEQTIHMTKKAQIWGADPRIKGKSHPRVQDISIGPWD